MPPTVTDPPALEPQVRPIASPRPAGRLRVLVADDHPLYRAGIVRALESSDAFDVVAETGDGREALEILRRVVPDVALLDVRMPGLDGIDVVAAVARYGPDVPIVLLSAFADEPLVRAGLEAGAAAYLVKTADREAICLDVAAAARAHATRSPAALRGSADVAPQRPGAWSPRLTLHEHRLLRLAGAGWEKAELATLLGIGEPELRRGLDMVLAKLGADTLDEALRTARAQGMIR